MPPTAARYRNFLARSRSRRDQQRKRNSTMPAPMQTSCLVSSPGASEAMTASPRVQRKKAMVSTSKPVRRRMRIKTKRPHSMAISTPKAVRMTWPSSASGRARLTAARI